MRRKPTIAGLTREVEALTNGRDQWEKQCMDFKGEAIRLRAEIVTMTKAATNRENNLRDQILSLTKQVARLEGWQEGVLETDPPKKEEPVVNLRGEAIDFDQLSRRVTGWRSVDAEELAQLEAKYPWHRLPVNNG